LTNTITFYTTPEYEEWRTEEDHSNGKKWKIKYYKGLGTSDRTEAKEYFSNLDRNLIPFTTMSDDPVGRATVDQMIEMCFNKKKAEERKVSFFLKIYAKKTKTNKEKQTLTLYFFASTLFLLCANSLFCLVNVLL